MKIYIYIYNLCNHLVIFDLHVLSEKKVKKIIFSKEYLTFFYKGLLSILNTEIPRNIKQKSHSNC